MAKALKTAALIVGGIALAATGIGLAAGAALASVSSLTVAGTLSIGALSALSSGLALASSLLTKTPSIPQSQSDRLTASIDPRTPRKTVLGSTAMPIDIRYEEWWGSNQDYCDWVVALASHAIDGLDEIWLNTDLAWSASGGVTSKFAGYFIAPVVVTEGSTATISVGSSGKWNASARLTGCAYARLRFKVTGNSKKAESPFSGGVPSRITIIGRGAKLYDPRRDSTVVGGSGPMRAADQSTWRYTTDDGAVIGENVPLQILRVLLGWTITNPVTGQAKLATGAGLPPKRIDMQSFMTAANQADEAVPLAAGGSEPRYRAAGVVSEGEDIQTPLNALCAACLGRFRDVGGKLALALAHDDLASAAADDGLNDDDVIGDFEWNPDPSLEATPTVARGRYVNPSSNSLYQLVDYPEVSIASPDDRERVLPLELGYVESPSQAQRIAKVALMRKRLTRTFSSTFDIRAWKYQVGDIVPLTFSALEFNRRLFRVAEIEVSSKDACEVTLMAEDHAIYAWDAEEKAAVNAQAIVPYDPLKDPYIQGINEASSPFA